MKAKYLLTALALPAMFAACSQEDIVTDGQMSQSSELLGKVAGDVVFDLGAESRLAWGATGGQAWEQNDEFSLFWVDENSTRKGTTTASGSALQGIANALYKTDDGKTFASENIIYEGKHILVYPVDKKHVTKKNITVVADSLQDGNKALGKRSVYISDSLVTIKSPLTGDAKPEYGVVYAAGYNETVKASVKPLTSNLVLNLNFNMPSTINEVTVKQVRVVTDKAIFATSGNLIAINDSVRFSAAGSKVWSMGVNLPTDTKVTKDNNKYTAQIALLPVEAEAQKYWIEVVTNYGVVTVDSAKYVTNTKGQYLYSGSEKQDASDWKLPAKSMLNLKQEFALSSDLSDKITYRGNENPVDNSYGKRITANVTVNMSDASITGMKVANSQELLDAYATYTLLGKTGVENFVLKSEKPFELTSEAVAAILANKKVTLTQELTGGAKADTIKLVGTHASIPSLGEMFDTKETVLVLGEGTWAIDVDAAAAVNTWAEVINAGTLTISESNPTEGAVALATPITNWATASFSGNVDMPVAYNQTKEGTTTVPATSAVDLSAGGTINGKADVAGILAANKGLVEIEKGAEITITGNGSLLTATTATMNNLGTITMKDNATVSVSANQNATTMGSIVLADRSTQANVYDSEKQGYIKWIYTENKVFQKELTDAFNCLVLKSNIKFEQNQVGDNVKHIQISATKVSVLPSRTDSYASTLELGVNSVIVDENCTLVVPVGTKITTDATVNNGRIEVYGEYIAGEESGSGKIYYFNGNANVATSSALAEAIKNSNVSVITLAGNLEVDSAMVVTGEKNINLNGKTITAPVWTEADDSENSYVFVVKSGGKLTISGEGNISSGEAEYSMAVWADGGEVVINGGTYTNDGEGSDLIYAKNGGKISIYGGTFIAGKKQEGVDGTKNKYCALNLHDGTRDQNSITVYGGTFRNFNPSNNYSEGPNTNFVTGGYMVKAWNVTTNAAASEANWTEPYGDTWNDIVDYTVVKIEPAE